MRKYQQLLLLIVSCFSITILFIYKSENSRLKYVLSVVNFFGRNDAIILRQLENITKQEHFNYEHPLPVWQAISNDFHAYASYWNQNELTAGGEALTLVAGKRDAVVNFRCALFYDGGIRRINGKFHFQRVDKQFEDSGSDFTSYNFFCRVVRNFGQPESVTFTSVSSQSKWDAKLYLRHIKRSSLAQHPLTICVDMINSNVSSEFGKIESNILQFFLHHKALGVNDFIIYNSNEFREHFLRLLQRPTYNLQLHLLPFNFPFNPVNATKRLRRFAELDCLIRNTNNAKYALFLEINEFFYPSARLLDNQSFGNYSDEINQFELPVFAVCIDPNQKLLIDNTFYDSEIISKQHLFIYRPHIPISTNLRDDSRNVLLSVSKVFAHRYIDCHKVGTDGLHEWRNSLREDYIQHIHTIRNNISALLTLT